MAGVFDTIADALGGKPVGPAKPSAAAPTNKVGYMTDAEKNYQQPDSVKAARAAMFAAQAAGHTTSGLDAAMQAHADKLHPVKGK